MRIKSILPLLLAGLLHVMPVLRAVLPAAQSFAPSSWALVLKVAAGAVTLLGSFHAVSAATAIIAPYTVNGTNGMKYIRQLGTSVEAAHSWSANTAPRTSAIFPLTPGLYLTNATGKIGGYPSKVMTSNITISAWENVGNTGASTSNVFVVTVVDATGPPVISIQPVSRALVEGATATFSVTAYGSPPFGYQWRFMGTNLVDATNSALTLPGITTNNAGAYSVIITNALNSVTSSVANLTVLVKPVFVSQPAPATQTVFVGDPVSFTVTAGGSLPMGFRWRRGGTTLTNFLLNSYTSTFTLPGAQLTDAGTYTVVLTNLATGSGILSSPAILNVMTHGPVDTDGDGMADDWELAHGLNPTDPADAALDADGDGMTNGQEYIAGTDPQDPGSYLKIDRLTAQPGAASLQFLAVSNRAYVIERSDLAGATSWQMLTNVAPASVNRLINATDPLAPDGGRIYRLVIP